MNEETEKRKQTREVAYEIELRSDGGQSIRATVRSVQDVVEFGRNASVFLKALEVGPVISKLAGKCVRTGGTLILQREKELPDDLRLAVSAAVIYPEGLQDNIIQSLLGITPNSRKAYVNSPDKRTSKYFTYDKKSKKLYINEEGILWAYEEMTKREASSKKSSSKRT